MILIDDGLATGSTMRAAVAALRRHRARRKIVVAVPVGASSTCAEFEAIADRCVCAIRPENFVRSACGTRISPRPTDDEVRDLLRAAVPPASSEVRRTIPPRRCTRGSSAT